ncbi:PAS/PAC sensor signal transduction histidine kinase [Tolypothrix sp. NIES-4075]|uniref:scytonemin biosynthesis sensor histidine kinase n=1 Tax=Tolypothrix sp. NIES-4075 TaxID=2005459 RepID=UPI000B5C4212|nr:scytonemin biosynthesis sensor histidine kinase [Tolypothrix sp. NIES-4075]GAX42478.1 PAS/PAC sensor signal transduction histidine kinase [Tolypothrix sp. NIES-4075]
MTVDTYTFIESNSKLELQTELQSFAQVLINRAVEPAFCLAANGQFLFVNDATCRMSEYSREELLSMTVDEIDIDFSPQVWSELWQLKSESLTFESRYRTKTSQILKVQVTLSYVNQGKEFICGFAPNKNDEVVLELVQYADKSNNCHEDLQNELKTSLSLLHSTLESTSIGILAVNLKGEITYYNQKFMDMWQLPTTINISKKYNRSKTKAFFEAQVKDLEVFRSCVWEMSNSSDRTRYDLVELNDGRIFAHYSQPQRTGEKIIGRVWSIWDVTESKRTEERLRLNEARFRTLAETTEAAIFLVQGQHLCYVNPAAEVLTGYTFEELLTDFDLDKLILSKNLRQVNKQEAEANGEYQEMQILTKNGTQRWLACTTALLDGMFDFNGKPVELITAIDITDYKQAEFERSQALEQTKRLSEQKERFVSMLCHQFRTPLNIVSFSADLLKRHIDKWTEEKKGSYFDLIQDGIKQISQLLDDILLFGKAEAAKLQYQPTEINLNQFCGDVIYQVQLANSNQQSINFVSPDNSTTAYLDLKMLQHILSNLLSNAIKYSPDNNTITLELSCSDENIIFQIKDAGIGISQQDQKQIFEPFYRGSNIDSIPGTGLGLAIVKTLVDLHGGEIAVESQVGAGSTFTVTLPSVKDLKCD